MKINLNAVYDQHNLCHFAASLLLAAALYFACGLGLAKAFYAAWGLGLAWEIGDVLKPDWRKGVGKPAWAQTLLCSDGFSLWDWFVPDLGGCACFAVMVVIGSPF